MLAQESFRYQNNNNNNSAAAIAPSSFASITQSASSIFDWLLEPSKNWAENTFIKRFADAMDCCSRPQFVVFDYFVAIVVGFISGLAVVSTSKTRCLIYAIVIVFLSALHTMAFLILRPMTARFDAGFGLMSSSFSLVGAILALLNVVGVSVDFLEEALMYVATLCLVGAAVGFLGSLMPLLKSLKRLIKATRAVRRRGASSKSGTSKSRSRSKRKAQEEEEEEEEEESKSNKNEKKKSSRSRSSRLNLNDLERREQPTNIRDLRHANDDDDDAVANQNIELMPTRAKKNKDKKKSSSNQKSQQEMELLGIDQKSVRKKRKQHSEIKL
jgi:flagellar biosynthesis GTPase FlhF